MKFDAADIDALRRSFDAHTNLVNWAKAQLPEIQRLHAEGKSLSTIGRLLGFSHQAIARALASDEKAR
jgi:hypothetical protein